MTKPVRLTNCNEEPSDEDFAVILADVTKVASKKAAVAHAEFFEKIASDINAKYHVGDKTSPTQSLPSLS